MHGHLLAVIGGGAAGIGGVSCLEPAISNLPQVVKGHRCWQGEVHPVQEQPEGNNRTVFMEALGAWLVGLRGACAGEEVAGPD